ncbi:sulfotransferase family protein [Crocosphaera sp. Alani8]|uniref:sulfotransferase family protein n=1 Tax=Crocosphaera sp. Alani8 TaxID=3038952 RepID=UPI00313C51CF
MMKFNELEQTTFIVGAERSGSTLLRLMLDHHPHIAWCSEFEYAVETEEKDRSNLEHFYEKLSTNRIFAAHGFTIDKTLNYPDLIKSFLIQRKQQTNKEIVGATCHKNFDRLLEIWKDARFIHVLRDPRDVARSSQEMGWAGNVWVGLDRWIHSEETWDKLASILPPERQLEIRYDDFIRKPEETLTKICNFIGTSYDSEMFNYIHTTDYQLPDPKLVSQWKHRLSSEDIRLIEARVGSLLDKRGFERSGLPSLAISPLKIHQLTWQSWWYCISFRIKRYGLKLVLLEFLSRKLGLEQWQKQLTLEMNEVTNAYCKFDGNPQITEARQKVLN